MLKIETAGARYDSLWGKCIEMILNDKGHAVGQLRKGWNIGERAINLYQDVISSFHLHLHYHHQHHRRHRLWQCWPVLHLSCSILFLFSLLILLKFFFLYPSGGALAFEGIKICR